jgi:uncharacterized membrane protein
LFSLNLPKLHPPSVHFPVALLLLASAAGLLYLYWRKRPELLTLTWWPMALGWLGLGLAIGTGLLAQSGLPPQAPYRSLLNQHIGAGITLVVIYGALLYARWMRRAGRHLKRTRRRGEPAQDESAQGDGTVRDWLLDDTGARGWVGALLVLGGLVVLLSAWSGGELVWTWGVNVPMP